MKKAAYRARYLLEDSADAVKGLLREGWDGLCYLYWFASPPTISKVLFGSYVRDRYCSRSIARSLRVLIKRGYIGRLDSKNTFFAFLGRERRYQFLDEFISVKAAHYQKKWDKKWRLLIYDVPQKNKSARESIRRYIKSLGFGMVQQSCWVSAYDFTDAIRAFCRQEKILQDVCLYEGNFVTGRDTDTLAEAAWKIGEVHAAYEEIRRDARQCIRAMRTKGISSDDFYLIYCRLFAQFKQALISDPFLPNEFTTVGKNRQLAEDDLKHYAQVFFEESHIL